MKNTFTEVELQVLSDGIDALYNRSLLGIPEIKMLAAMRDRMKAAGPKTLREKALGFVAGVLDGTEDELNPLRLDAAKMVIENYWSFDHENEDAPPLEVIPTISRWSNEDKCVEMVHPKSWRQWAALVVVSHISSYTPLDRVFFNIAKEIDPDVKWPLSLPLDQPERWTGDNIPPNARIKDLDCSTPREFEKPLDFAKIAAEGRSLKGHCPSHRIALYPDGICPVCDYEKHKEPMTLERAVEVLNKRRREAGA